MGRISKIIYMQSRDRERLHAEFMIGKAIKNCEIYKLTALCMETERVKLYSNI